MKRLIVCCDGTWNDEDSAASFTNVVRMARAIRPQDDVSSGQSIPQIVYYHSGVGTGGDEVEKVLSGAIGLGLSRNVRDAYAFIVHNYAEGDELFLFGFSRGAYTARSVAGLIGWAGLIQKGDMDDFAMLWEGYRLRGQTPQPLTQYQFPDRRAPVRIKCIGVWDTVGALGIPGHLGDMFTKFYQFLDTSLGTHVENAFHAMAVDEHRDDFKPTLWQKQPGAEQVLQQVWFAGAHSNVGGGYQEHGLSDITLAWMASRVIPMLSLDENYLTTRQDRRDGWAFGKIYDSATGFFGLRRQVDRQVLVAGGDATCESIHASVEARLAAGPGLPGGRYAPANLPDGAPAGSVKPLDPLEQRLRWTTPDPAQTGQSNRPPPTFVDRLLNSLGGG